METTQWLPRFEKYATGIKSLVIYKELTITCTKSSLTMDKNDCKKRTLTNIAYKAIPNRCLVCWDSAASIVVSCNQFLCLSSVFLLVVTKSYSFYHFLFMS